MKMRAIVLLLALPGLCLGRSGLAVEAPREFDVEVVVQGRWHPTWVDWDAAGRMWLSTASQETGSQRRGSILIFDRPATSPGRRFYTGPVVNSFVFHGDNVIAGTAAGALRLVTRDFPGERVIAAPLFSSGPLSDLRSVIDGWIYAAAQDGYDRASRLVRFKPGQVSFQTLATVPGASVAFDLSWERELFFSLPEGPHLSHVGLFQRYLGSGGISNAATYRKVEDHAMTWGPGRNNTPVSRMASITGNIAPTPAFEPATPAVPFERVAGLCIYDGGAWPERFHGNSYVCDPDLHLVHEDVISRAESAYYAGTQRTTADFITSSDALFQPHAIRYGPDGALYILGSHRATHPATAAARSAGLLSAAPHGYVWRVQHKHPRITGGTKLEGASTADLARALEHPNGWVRQTALRLLIEEHSASATPVLTNLLYASRVAPARVAAVWGLQRLGALTMTEWTNSITDYHPAVQKSAWLALAESQEPITREIEKIAGKAFKDSEERVRIAILMALSKGPLTADGRKEVAKLCPDLKDVWSKSILLTIAREAPMEFLKVAFASDRSEHFREFAALLAKQIARDAGAREQIHQLIAKSDPEKTEKLAATVKDALANGGWHL